MSLSTVILNDTVEGADVEGKEKHAREGVSPPEVGTYDVFNDVTRLDSPAGCHQMALSVKYSNIVMRN